MLLKAAKLVLLSMITVSLVGCASGGPTGKEVLTGSIAPSKARIVMYRTSPLGLALQPDYTINGKAIAAAKPSGFIVCNVNPGTHNLSVANAGGDQTFYDAGTQNAKVTVNAGETAYLLAEPKLGLVVGFLTLTQVGKTQGIQDTASLSKIEGQCT